jgi:hypothetical protein
VGSWYQDVNVPALVISANPVTNNITIVLDSSKLSVGTQIAVDLSRSLIWQLLGFTNSSVFTTNGTFTNVNVPNFNPQGNMINVCCDIAPETHGFKGLVQKILFTIPMEVLSQSSTNITFPETDTRVIRVMPYSANMVFNKIHLFIENEVRAPLYFLEGLFYVEFDICRSVMEDMADRMGK